MGRFLFSFVLASAAALGEQPQNDMPKLDPYRAKALENALHPPESSSKNQQGFGNFTVPPLTAQMLLAETPGNTVEVCAIPLTRFPVAANIDRGIQRKLNPDARKIDRIPLRNPMPTCQEDHPLPR